VTPRSFGAALKYWLESSPALGGGLGLVEASVNSDLTTWARVNMDPTGGQPDPDGGSNAYVLTDTLDGGAVPHYRHIALTNQIAGVAYISGYAKIGTRGYLVIYADAANRASLNLSDGSTSNLGASTTALSVNDVGGGWYNFVFECSSLTALEDFRVYISDTPVSPYAYVGNGAGTVYVYGLTCTQSRVSSVTDLGPGATPATQTTDVNRPLAFRYLDDTGAPLVERETGRVAFLTATELAAFLSGASPSYILGGYGTLGTDDGDNPAFIYASGSGASETPLYRQAGSFKTQRYDGSTKTGVFGADATAGAPFSWVVRCRQIDGTHIGRTLWLNGVQLGSEASLAKGSAVTMTSATTGRTSGTTQATRWGSIWLAQGADNAATDAIDADLVLAIAARLKALKG